MLLSEIFLNLYLNVQFVWLYVFSMVCKMLYDDTYANTVYLVNINLLTNFYAGVYFVRVKVLTTCKQGTTDKIQPQGHIKFKW